MKPTAANELAADILRSHLPDWHVADASPHDAPTLIGGTAASNNIANITVQIKAMGAIRIADLIGRFATAALELQSRSAANSTPIALIGVDRVTRGATQSLAQFAANHAPGLGWGIFDAHGGLRLHVPALDIDITTTSRAAARKRPSRGRVFTDLNRWLWKLLLLRDAPTSCFPQSARGRPINANELAALAQVSHETAYQFVHTMQHRRYLTRTVDGFHLLDPQELLTAWRDEDRRAPAPRLPVRRLFATPDAPLSLSTLATTPSWPVSFSAGGFSACERLGLLHTRYALPELHVRGDATALLQHLDLMVCDPREAELTIINSHFPESVFRGSQLLDGVPVVDAWQAALDVVSNPARGVEQAEFIQGLVMQWSAP